MTIAKLYLDVTTLWGAKRLTGVQKVALSVLATDSPLLPVTFDSSIGTYREIKRIEEPSAPREDSSGFRFPWATTLTWSLLSVLRFTPWLEKPYSFLRKAAVTLFKSLFPAAELDASYTLGKPIYDLQNSKLWLIDVPSKPELIEFLANYAVAANQALFAYVYDMIPLEPTEISHEAKDRPDQELFEQYLDLLSLAEGLLFISSFTQDRFMEHLKMRGMRYRGRRAVSWPPDTDLRRPLHSVQHEFPVDRRLLTWLEKVPENPLILTVAPFTRRKNLRLVLFTFLRLHLAGTRVRLVVVAPAMTRIDLPALWLAFAIRMGLPRHFLVTMNISDRTLDHIYVAANLAWVPSFLEGFGLPIIEAQKRGTRVLASDIPTGREIRSKLPIELADPRSPSEWARKTTQELALGKTTPHSVLPPPMEFVKRMLELAREV